MSLAVQSFPELYTTLMGWKLYDELWTLLRNTGIAFVPFIFIIVRHIAQPYESQETKDATGTSLRRMEMSFIGTLFLILTAVAPMFILDPTVISYTPLCQSEGQHNTYHPGDTQTTWDKAFTVPRGDIRVPLWWYAVMAVAEGLTSASNTMVSCVPNLRKMVTQVDMAQISDPALKKEVQQFEEDCYLPARTQYLQDEQNKSVDNHNLQMIASDRKKYGEDDTEWAGSHSFQDAYYSHLIATQPIQGFPYDPAKDINANNSQIIPPAYSSPNCNDWWKGTDGENGLQTKLYHVLPKTFWTQFRTFFDSHQQREDDVEKKILDNNATGYHAATRNDKSVYADLTDSLGVYSNSFDTYPKLYAAAEAAPIIQSLLLLLIYAFLPFAIVFSGYKPAAFISGAMIIFSMIYWSFIWHLVGFVDSTLMEALYGSNWFSQHVPSAMLADMLAGTLILVAPLFWFSFMGAMGVAVGDIVSGATGNLSGINNNVAQAGGKGAASLMSQAGSGGNSGSNGAKVVAAAEDVAEVAAL